MPQPIAQARATRYADPTVGDEWTSRDFEIIGLYTRGLTEAVFEGEEVDEMEGRKETACGNISACRMEYLSPKATFADQWTKNPQNSDKKFKVQGYFRKESDPPPPCFGHSKAQTVSAVLRFSRRGRAIKLGRMGRKKIGEEAEANKKQIQKAVDCGSKLKGSKIVLLQQIIFRAKEWFFEQPWTRSRELGRTECIQLKKRCWSWPPLCSGVSAANNRRYIAFKPRQNNM
ncbi:hypothetical protein B0H16DRAFT_1474354 [Mycena metata]|uniref:Uncharacterized protein n=1 Tax=Mycena metata TaxID=1033252 RepID=A0AAD7HI15_9AGAR|nr:hypothetical protein B0H16DRAFT_1474354 [Mycena metata]